ncbi:MAG: nucleotidyltransferase family protein [Nevskia sp.]|nr:nucleotidyltransferase family protein [Nevskia sp.]
MHPAPRIAAVVLAAGRSTRMAGCNKLLAGLGGIALVRHAAQAAVAAGLAPVVAVTGNAAAQVEAALAGLPLRAVHNPDFAAGLASSVRTGVQALGGAAGAAADGAVFLLGDMPLLRAAHLLRLMQAFADAPAPAICVPTYGGRRGNPVLWSAAYFPRLAELAGDRGARVLFEEYAAHLVEVPMPDDAVLVDIDTDAALEQVRARFAAQPHG